MLVDGFFLCLCVWEVILAVNFIKRSVTRFNRLTPQIYSVIFWYVIGRHSDISYVITNVNKYSRKVQGCNFFLLQSNPYDQKA